MDELDKLLAEIQGEPKEASNSTQGPYKTKKEWKEALDKYKAEKGTTVGFQEGRIEWVDPDGTKWDYVSGGTGKPGTTRRQGATKEFQLRRKASERTQSTVDGQEYTFEGSTREAVKAGRLDPKIQDLHHMRGLQQMAPFLEGLSHEDQLKFVQWMKGEGFPIGNYPENLTPLYSTKKEGGSGPHDIHQGDDSIHRWMRDHRLEPTTNQKEYKALLERFKGKSLNERMGMMTVYLDSVQGAIQEKLQRPTDYTALDERAGSTGEIQSGPRAGERMPTNRSTLGLDPDELARTGEVNFEGEKLLAEMQGEPFMGQPSWRQRAAAAMGRVPLKGIGIGAITGAVGGAKPSLADPSTVSKLIKGDTQGLAADAVVGAGIGGGIQATIQGLSAMGRVGLANAAGFIAGKVVPPTFLGAGIADQTFAHPEVQRKYQEAEPGLPALGAAFSQFTPEMGKVEQTAPNRSQRNTLRRLQKDQEDR